MTVRVVTDSSCDLPDELIEQLGVEVVPLMIRFGDEELVDRRDLSTQEFWSRLATTDTLPETSAPSVGAFEEVFRRLAADGADGIVCINISSRLSATMQSAQLAAKAVADVCPVEIVDSATASMGQGNLVRVAAALAREGASLEAIATDARDRADRTRLYGAIDTLEFLRRGGRIGGAQALLGSVLSIKPIITTKDGIVEPAGRVRTRSKALQWLADTIKRSSIENLCVLHGNAPDVDQLLAMLAPEIDPADVLVNVIGPVIGTHTGPRVIGATWQERRA